MADTFLANRKEDWEQLKYLASHKARVYQTGRSLGVPRMQLLMHDLRKFTPSEWKPYREYWFDKDGPNKADIIAFKKAVVHHKKNNPHHNYKGAPLNTQLEAVSDWYSVGPKKTKPFKQWAKENMNNFPLSEATKEYILKTAKADFIGPEPTKIYKAQALATKYGPMAKKIGPWMPVVGTAVGMLYKGLRAAHANRVIPRQGIMGKVQQFAKAHNMPNVEREPGLYTGATVAGLGLLGNSIFNE